MLPTKGTKVAQILFMKIHVIILQKLNLIPIFGNLAVKWFKCLKQFWIQLLKLKFDISNLKTVSASSPFVGFGELNDNTIKDLTSLLSVEQKIEFIEYTCGLWNEKCI